MGLRDARARRLSAPACAAGLALLALLAGCGREAGGPARFAPSDCRVVKVTDAATGRPIAGIEDIALSGPRLILSAPAAARLVPAGAIAGGLRPHGIAAEGARLAVVNRRIGASGRVDPVVLELELAGGRARLAGLRRGPGFCALNDVAFWQGGLLATRDRDRCPQGLAGELLVRPESGSLVVLDDAGMRVLAEGLAYANGVAVLPDGGIAVAETRAGRVRLSDGRMLAVPGHPDNLTVAANGRLVVGVIPSLWRFGLHLTGHRARAPSRLVALDPASGAVEWLFDDPEGRLLPGITVGLLAEGMLVAGAVRAQGLLVCGGKG